MRSRISFVIILSIIISFFKPFDVYAMYPSNNVVPTCGSGLDWANYWDNVWNIHFQDTVNHTFDKRLTLDEYMAQQGFYTSQNEYTKTKYVVKKIIENNPNAFGGKTEEEVTEDDMNEWLQNNITVNNYGDGNVQFTTSGDFDNVVRKIGYDIQANYDPYVYSYDIRAISDWFTSVIQWQKMCSVLERYQDTYYMIVDYKNNSIPKMYGISKTVYKNVFALRSGIYRENSMIRVDLYNALDNQEIVSANNVWTWDEETKNFISGGDPSIGFSPYSTPIVNNYPSNIKMSSSAWSRRFLASSGGVYAYRYFTNVEDVTVDSLLHQPYYINNEAWSNYNNDYSEHTYNTDNSNTSYQDIVNNIDNSYHENNEILNPDDVEKYIKDVTNPTPTSNPSDNGGGGSGGSGVSGNGGSSGDSNIFDWLSSIGSVLGNLIKNLGNVLAELVESIASVISNLFESIPTIFSDFLGGVIGWLPPELRALITLSISAMVIVGLIKMFKG